MKEILIVFTFSFFSVAGFSQSFIDQLKNSIERTDGGAGAIVEYHVYLSPTNEKVFYGVDWTSGSVNGNEGESEFFELTRKNGDEEESLMINLESTSFMELEIKEIKGKKKFIYHFYY